MAVLLLKLFLVPSLIALLTMAGRRWGPAIAGWLSGFPVVAGPVLLVLGLEQGPLFAARTAHSALAGMLGTVAFCLGYAWAAVRLRWYICAIAGALSFAAASVLLFWLSLPLGMSLAVSIGGLLVVPAAFPQMKLIPSPPLGAPSRIELPARMLAGATLSVGIAAFADRLGPTFSGVLSVFPVIGLVFGVFSHVAWGGGGAILLLNRMVRSLHAFAGFCFTAAIAMPRAGVLLGCLTALCAALLIQAMTFKRA